MTKAAFSGNYADLKFVKTRSVAAITIEIPIEQAAAFVAAFGTPIPGKECPVALARMGEPTGAAAYMPKTWEEQNGPKPKRSFNELPMPQQAGIRCQDLDFNKYLMSLGVMTDTASYVRSYCGVSTRSELSPNTKAGNRWLLLESAFQAWLASPEHVDAAS